MTVMRPNPPPPPPGPAPRLNLDLSADEIGRFAGLVAKGKERYAGILENALVMPADADRAEREEKFNKYYKTMAAEDQETYPGAIDTLYVGADSGHAINSLSPQEGAIIAYGNVNPKDMPPDQILSSSDVIYFQYLAAAGGKPPVPLLTIQRTNVASGTGSNVLRCIDALFGKNALVSKRLEPGDPTPGVTKDVSGQKFAASLADVFYAWLGTENATSACWLVREHGDQLSITGISHVVQVAPGKLTIYFTPATGHDMWRKEQPKTK
jgi:hypothetical protein